MRTIDAATVEAMLRYPDLVDVLAEAFRTGAHAPPRHHHTISLDGRPDATWLLMPAWTAAETGAATAGAYAGVKLVSVFPDNGVRFAKPAIQGVYLLISTATGEPLALIDAPRLTVWRTAAASALASRHLARPEASRLAMLGAGALAPYLVRAHASVRPIGEVALYNRTRATAVALAGELVRAMPHLAVTVAPDAETAVRGADIVTSATISKEPVIRGAWLSPGTHVDCVGAYRPDMREADDDVIRRARIWVDTRAGALHEAGDIVVPMASGLIGEGDIQGDLYDIARGCSPGRRSAEEITFFKSVGASIEDLAAAIYLYERTSA